MKKILIPTGQGDAQSVGKRHGNGLAKAAIVGAVAVLTVAATLASKVKAQRIALSKV